ncbi:uncharacterized protein C12orf56-like isoform X2 [Anneissia japonica]|uniref:uncharacterized protein C12orf56-like isoform X2 n=1 Tax=Anneissia japonica TaxID=1529436 RepID=UPI0014259843|nr:uncharacterized protein C12orf56-like isoform X2 [Anneissia japonica]
MARNGLAIVSKRNLKLENFLKVNLAQDVFDRIQAYEACIVNSAKEKKALKFKYAVLGDERLYITENPPKVIKEEEGLHLQDVISITLVNDFPDFLSGEERENTQHILIKHLQERPVPKTRKKPTKKDLSQANEKPNEKSTPDLRISDPAGTTFQGDRPEEAIDKQHKEKNGDGLRLNRSFDETTLYSLKLEDGFSSDDNEPMSASLPSSTFKTISNEKDQQREKEEENLKAAKQSKGKVESVDTCRPLPQRPVHNKDSAPRLDTSNTFTADTASTLVNRDKNSSKIPQSRNLPSPELDSPNSPNAKKKSQPFKFNLDAPQSKESVGKKSSDTKNRRRKSLAKPRSLDIEISSAESSQPLMPEETEEVTFVKEEVEMHLYILSPFSTFLMQLRSTWNNYIIRSTRMLEATFAADKFTNGCSQQMPKGASRAQLQRQFQQMKEEILNAANDIEQLFELIAELGTAAAKYFIIKKLFWKNVDLFEFFVNKLQCYLPKSTTVDTQSRADELEMVVIIFNTLAQMLRETEMLPDRLNTLQANNGKMVLDLLVMLTCLPEVPQRWRPPRFKTSSMLLETDAHHWETYSDAEVSKLVQEITNVSTAVTFELILIAHQANWGNDEGKFFNICWLVKVLDSFSTTEKFVERLLAQAMKLLLPSKDSVISPDDAVLLFQQFFVLQTFIEYSSSITSYIRNNYMEEFRYYVQSPHILEKLPVKYPIRRLTLQLIDEVLSCVLQKKTVLKGQKV